MREVLEVLLRVTGVLETLQVPYLVGGSIASSLHGVPRATIDADVVADLQQSDVTPLVEALRPEFYLDEPAIRDAVSRRATFNVIHLGSLLKVDVFVARDDPAVTWEMERRRPFTLSGDPPGEMMVATPEDVIVHKLYWYRLGEGISDRQWGDARGVLEVHANAVDLAYMRKLAAHMDVTDLLIELLAEVGIGA